MPRELRKRPLQEADPNALRPEAPSKKKASSESITPKTASKAASACGNAQKARKVPVAKQEPPRIRVSIDTELPTRRIPKGPKNESFLPNILPEEAKVHKLLPESLICYDGTGDKRLTLGNGNWWLVNGSWIHANLWSKLYTLDSSIGRIEKEAIAALIAPNLCQVYDNLDWMCFCRPHSDRRKEGQTIILADQEFGTEELQTEERRRFVAFDACGCEKPCIRGHFALRHPAHKWICTVLGEDRRLWWAQEVMKRDPTAWNMYIGNGFYAYGVLEVVENALKRFDQAFSSRGSHALSVWPELEGLALGLAYDGLSDFCLCDHGVRTQDLISLIGSAVLFYFDFYIAHEEVKPRPEIKCSQRKRPQQTTPASASTTAGTNSAATSLIDVDGLLVGFAQEIQPVESAYAINGTVTQSSYPDKFYDAQNHQFNLGLILSLFLQFAQSHTRTSKLIYRGPAATYGGPILSPSEAPKDWVVPEYTDWRFGVLYRAGKHGVQLVGPYGMEDTLSKIRETMRKKDADGRMMARYGGKPSWKNELLKYKKKYGFQYWNKRCDMGGDEYDITKFDEAKKEKYRLKDAVLPLTVNHPNTQ